MTLVISLCLSLRPLPPLLTPCAQSAEWDPLVAWWEGRSHAKLATTTELHVPAHPPAALAAAAQYLRAFSAWQRPGVAMAIDTLRSFVIGAALLEGRTSASKAVFLSRLESEFQTQRFGEVAWAHPLDRAAITTRVAAAAFFVRSLAPPQ